MADEFGPVEPVEKFGDVEPVQAAPKKEDPLAQYPTTAFALGGLNKLGMGGGSSALALKDMLASVDSRTGQKGIPEGMGPKELYLSNKAFYDDGFKRLAEANPKADLASNAVLLAGPGMGAKLGTQVVRGAARGTMQGAVGGESSVVDNPEGVVKDAAAGAAFGGAGTAIGGVPGKLLEKVGAGAGSRLFGVLRRAMGSAKGEAGKQAQEAMGGVENKFLANKMHEALANRQDTWIGGIPEGIIRQNLGARIANADEKIIDRALRPIDVRKRAEQKVEGMGKAAIGAAKKYALAGVGGVVGGEVAEKMGVDKRIGWAIGSAAPLWALRKSWGAVLDHPAALKAVSRLQPVGAKLSMLGSRGGGAAGLATHLAVMTKRDPELAKALELGVAELPVDAAGEEPNQR